MFDTLENRRLMSITVVNNNGNVNITGDRYNDLVSITVDANGLTTIVDNVANPVKTWVYNNVYNVTGKFGLGRDTVTVDMHKGNMTTGVSVDGEGNGDTIVVDGLRIKVFGGPGADILTSNSNAHGEILGGHDDDNITVNGNAAGIGVHGGHGNDTIDLRGVNNTISPIDGMSYKPYAGTGEKGKETDGNYGGGGTIHGSRFSDLLRGSPGVDTINGYDGDDICDLDGGEADAGSADVFNGGNHIDGDSCTYFQLYGDVATQTEWHNGIYAPN